MRIRHLVPVLLLAVVCLSAPSLATSADLLGVGSHEKRDHQTYTATPKHMGDYIYYLNLPATKHRWEKEAKPDGREQEYVNSHFDELIARSIAIWAGEVLQQGHLEIVCITALTTGLATLNEPTGLLIVTRIDF